MVSNTQTASTCLLSDGGKENGCVIFGLSQWREIMAERGQYLWLRLQHSFPASYCVRFIVKFRDKKGSSQDVTAAVISNCTPTNKKMQHEMTLQCE